MARGRRDAKRNKRRWVLAVAIIITIAALALLFGPDLIEKHKWDHDRSDIMELYKGSAYEKGQPELPFFAVMA